MENVDTELLRFDDSLFEQIDVLQVKISALITDDAIDEIFKDANPVSGLRTSKQSVSDSAYLFNLLSIQSPIICYRDRKRFKALTGCFTLIKLRAAIAQHLLPSDHAVMVFVLRKKPSVALRRSIVLFDLTNDLLAKCFISDTKKISFFLRAWFRKDEGKKSIYQSKEWLTYFPSLNTSAKVAEYLSISKADL
ncbi:hypothetical protein JYB87_09290 [Shewanella avicenniae]|uniref:Uncharacterized protein n=1 Tax=Shewanella avicenniae TaxID=2814294 RepID=A0ABX7QLX9_9GAMM|nr:hypothetical protein [Shewanella avicenniae]QSX31990.1 hypothetical protein JYB87_09290 [Shewanella avicenniae]